MPLESPCYLGKLYVRLESPVISRSYMCPWKALLFREAICAPGKPCYLGKLQYQCLWKALLFREAPVPLKKALLFREASVALESPLFSRVRTAPVPLSNKSLSLPGLLLCPWNPLFFFYIPSIYS